MFGVIVEDESGARRGLLLPDIPGIDNAEQQVEIAARKAGIGRGEPVRLCRFQVERFRENCNPESVKRLRQDYRITDLQD